MIPVAASILRTGPAGAGDGPVLRGPWAGRSGGPAADRPAETPRPRGTLRSWPLLVLAAPAAAEVWSGWAGIAQKTGCWLVSPLPGIWPSLHLDTTITLPVGVEAYAAYALRAWLGSEHEASPRTRRFAKWSAICSFALGMAGQVAYHLLAQAGAVRAPWSVTTIDGVPRGRDLLHHYRDRATAGEAGGPADPDHRCRRWHAGGGEPPARRRRRVSAARDLGGTGIRGTGGLAGRGLAAGFIGALGSAAGVLLRRRRYPAHPADMVRRGDRHRGRAGRPGGTGRGRGPGALPAYGGAVLPPISHERQPHAEATQIPRISAILRPVETAAAKP